MVVNICPRCGKLLKDSKYCDSCGSSINVGHEIQEYEECPLTNKFYKIKSKVSYEDFIFHIETIENPQYVDEENEYIYFLKKENIQSLHHYIGNRKLDLNEINKITMRIIEIFKDIEEDKLIINAINLEDFWLIGDKIESLKLWNRRRFIKNKVIVDNFDYGYSIVSPEVLNKASEKFGEESNVYIFGRLFLQLILNSFGILSDDEEMYYGYNLRLFRADLPYKFHNFIMKCLNITKEKRLKSIKELEESYKYIIDKNNNIEKTKLKVKSLRSTNVGV
ncbi:MAG: inactive serine/threonine-protein kinase VRK3, partial [Clostridium sp.]|nr:inactive serine/threonine-protein kinase VRK3 [Clostridium sp.]